MKKQILVLVFFVLAGLANVSDLYGQSVAGSAPRPLTCNDDALHPLAGKEYTYTVAATPTGGQYTWWATKDMDFITTVAGTTTTNMATKKLASGAGADLTAISTNYATTAATDNVKITWSTSVLSGTSYKSTVAGKTPTFVAVYYTPLSGSCADNFKVFELDPKNGFTVDILNMLNTAKTPLAYDAAESQCFANVSSAKYNTGKMDYLYGINTLYYEVVAANFSGAWTPTFKLTGLDAKQTVVIQWDYTTAFTAPVTVTDQVASATPVSTTLTNTSGGASIYVKVTITNNSFEGLADKVITLAVDGKNTANELDVVNTTCIAPATPDYLDSTDQTLKLRPTVVEGTTSTISPNVGIVPKNP